MSKANLKEYIKLATGITGKEANIVADVVIKGMQNIILNQEKLSLPNFGSFKIVEHAARKARNPKTGETVEVPAKRFIRFKASRKMKDMLNE